MDEKLKRLIENLGEALNDALSDSDKIAAAIGEIKSAGYNAFIVLEATIGVGKRDGLEEDAEEGNPLIKGQSSPIDQASNSEPLKKFELNGKDRRFLKARKISTEEGEDKKPKHK